ncbi:MAG: hypothetical protein KatS3mg104_2988 [Phycisphaerae bacterium]|nr:MAG: hypothetical protein KatS3mg104_2988 [Phycisphaerae bacterium]
MKVALVLNGPPRSGKDEAGKQMAEKGAAVDKFAEPIRAMLRAVFGLSDEEIERLKGRRSVPYRDTYLEIDGGTLRDVMIDFSEGFMKKWFGEDVFGKMLAERIKSSDSTFHAITDGGFVSEMNPLVDALGKDNVFVIHLRRPGCTFDGDSRNYVRLPGNMKFVKNDGSLEEFRTKIDKTLKEVEDEVSRRCKVC